MMMIPREYVETSAKWYFFFIMLIALVEILRHWKCLSCDTDSELDERNLLIFCFYLTHEEAQPYHK